MNRERKQCIVDGCKNPGRNRGKKNGATYYSDRCRYHRKFRTKRSVVDFSKETKKQRKKRRRSCLNKTPFSTKLGAKITKQYVERKDKIKMKIYKCHYEYHYHLATVKRKK